MVFALFQLLFLQFHSSESEASIQPGCQQSQSQEEQGDESNSEDAKFGDAYCMRWVDWHVGGGETGGSHAGVMHDGDRRAHHDRAGSLCPTAPRFFIAEVKGNP